MQREMSSPVYLPDWLPLPSKLRQRRAVRAIAINATPPTGPALTIQSATASLHDRSRPSPPDLISLGCMLYILPIRWG